MILLNALIYHSRNDLPKLLSSHHHKPVRRAMGLRNNFHYHYLIGFFNFRRDYFLNKPAIGELINIENEHILNYLYKLQEVCDAEKI